MSAETYPKRKRWPIVTGLVVAALVALPLAFYTPDIPAATLRAKYTTAASTFLTVEPGLAVHVRDEGPRDAPVLVLVHGSNASLQAWEPWVAQLSDSFRIISLDLPGHGLTGASPTADYSPAGFVRVVNEVAAAKGLTRFAIGGNSMGGGVAWRYAAAHPEQITGLILVDAAGAPSKTESDPPLAFRLARLPYVRDAAIKFLPRSLIEKSLQQSLSVDSVITPAMVDRYWELQLHPGNRDATVARFAAGYTRAVPADLKAITMPTLIMWGAEDRLIPVDAAAWFSKALPNSRVVIYDNVGHAPMEEAPERSAADVRSFLDSLQTTPSPTTTAR
ncbi:MAG: alpha/beta fold hydrolase [Polymorphobacter sp.]